MSKKRASDRNGIVAVSHCGGEEQVLSTKQTIRFVFHDFETLPQEAGRATVPSCVLCHGHHWTVELYAGGKGVKNGAYVSIFLKCLSNGAVQEKVKALFRFELPGYKTDRIGPDHFCAGSTSIGLTQWILRSYLVNQKNSFLVDGNLTVDVEIQVFKAKASVWKPTSTLQQDLSRLLKSAAETGDAEFLVENETVLAHRTILQARAPGLAALAADYPKSAAIPLPDTVTLSLFRCFLEYIYLDVPPKDLKENARNILNIADCFTCKGLKMSAEAELISSCISVDRVTDLLLLADAKNCALLKEAAIEFIAENPKAVMSTPGWDAIAASAPLLQEIMTALVDKSATNLNPSDDESQKYKRLCVSDLRERLEKKKLDVDGSKEVLISRLEEATKNDEAESPSSQDDSDSDTSSTSASQSEDSDPDSSSSEEQQV